MLAKNDAKGRKQHLWYLATNIWVVLHKKIHLRGPWKGEIQAFSCENEHKQLYIKFPHVQIISSHFGKIFFMVLPVWVIRG